MKADRLLKLADFLETVPRRQFQMQEWISSKLVEKYKCDFAGCAIGWAAHQKMFSGFTLEHGIPHYGKLAFWDAVDAVFDLPNRDSVDLFGQHQVCTPKQVAKRIRKFVQATSSPPSGARQGVSGSKTSSPGRE